MLNSAAAFCESAVPYFTYWRTDSDPIPNMDVNTLKFKLKDDDLTTVIVLV